VDGTAALVREHFPAVVLIANDENRGFPAAVNQGLASSNGDVVALVNPDCVVPPATLHALRDYLHTHPDVGVVGPRLRGENGEISITAHPLGTFTSLLANRLRRVLPRRFSAVLGRSARWASYDACLHGTEAQEVGMMIAACVAVRGSLLRRLGGLDEGYFMYCEDMELCLQSWRAGARVVYLPTVEAYHAGGGSSGDRSHVWPHHSRSLLRFHARHRPRTFPLVRLTLLARALVGMLLGLVQDAVEATSEGPRRRRFLAWARIARLTLSQSRKSLIARHR
jgi:GT2 family glycosyltransferase